MVCKTLRAMAQEAQGIPGFNYTSFKDRLALEGFTDKQNGPLRLRLDLLESFMDIAPQPPNPTSIANPVSANDKDGQRLQKKWEARKAKEALRAYQTKPELWSFEPGSLTIVDLSCPFVDDSAACVLFNICLALFLEKRNGVSRVIALDEAHKVRHIPPFPAECQDKLTNDYQQFMTNSAAANAFTENLLSVIRQQRHLATRVIIATQEPTISPKLLNLSSMTFVHRFTSPEWLNALKAHLAGASRIGANGSERKLEEIFETIVNLNPGEALLFAPSAMLHVREDVSKDGEVTRRGEKLGMRYLKIRVRKRLTADGGRSIMAT